VSGDGQRVAGRAMSGDSQRFAGRAALVTGASRGIGLAIAQRLLADGARVCITARRAAELDAALGSLASGEHAIAVAGASDDAEHRRAAVAATLEAFGSLDILVNNAATNPLYGPFVEADLDAVRKILEVNVVAPLAWVQETHRTFMHAHGGAILNVASAGGLVAGELLGAYNTSKAALVHQTRQLALELGPAIRVNGIAPAVVKTRFARALYDGGEADLAALYPLRRLGEPEDTAALAAFLLSDEASWITGQTVVADGGITLSDPGGRRSLPVPGPPPIR
jgi:NAD(P)-dependent dehydrogenase (short-subunit alcohol dehydrogenase family)